MSVTSEYLIEISEYIEKMSAGIITSDLAGWLYTEGYGKELENIVLHNDKFARIQKFADFMNTLSDEFNTNNDRFFIYSFIEARSERTILSVELDDYISSLDTLEEKVEALEFFIELSQIKGRKQRLYEFYDSSLNYEKDDTFYNNLYKTILY